MLNGLFCTLKNTVHNKLYFVYLVLLVNYDFWEGGELNAHGLYHFICFSIASLSVNLTPCMLVTFGPSRT